MNQSQSTTQKKNLSVVEELKLTGLPNVLARVIMPDDREFGLFTMTAQNYRAVHFILCKGEGLVAAYDYFITPGGVTGERLSEADLIKYIDENLLEDVLHAIVAWCTNIPDEYKPLIETTSEIPNAINNGAISFFIKLLRNFDPDQYQWSSSN